MLPRAQDEFPSLGSAELGLEEGAAVQIQAGICPPFAEGSKDTAAAGVFTAQCCCPLPRKNCPASSIDTSCPVPAG